MSCLGNPLYSGPYDNNNKCSVIGYNPSLSPYKMLINIIRLQIFTNTRKLFRGS